MECKAVAAMLTILQAAYQKFYAGHSKEQISAVQSLWASAMAEYPEEVVIAALQQYIRESPFPPTVADIVQRLEAMRNIGQDDDETLWQKLVEAVCDGIYHAKERFDALPYACQRFIGSPRELREMALMNFETLRTVTRGQFMKRVAQLREQERILLDTPKEVLDLLRQAADVLSLPE